MAAYQEAVRLATLRYTAGLSSYMEVLEAQQQLFPAQNSLAQVRLARLVTLVQLYKALGGGWNLKDPGDPGSWSRPRAGERQGLHQPRAQGVGASGWRGPPGAQPYRNSAAGPQVRPWQRPMPQLAWSRASRPR